MNTNELFKACLPKPQSIRTYSQQCCSFLAKPSWEVFLSARKSTDGRMQELYFNIVNHLCTRSSKDPYNTDCKYNSKFIIFYTTSVKLYK